MSAIARFTTRFPGMRDSATALMVSVPDAACESYPGSSGQTTAWGISGASVAIAGEDVGTATGCPADRSSAFAGTATLACEEDAIGSADCTASWPVARGTAVGGACGTTRGPGNN